MSQLKEDDFKVKLDCLFEYFTTFRFNAEQRRNFLRMVKDGGIKEKFNPSYRVELEHLEKLIDITNDVFPYHEKVQNFKKELTKNHNAILELQKILKADKP